MGQISAIKGAWLFEGQEIRDSLKAFQRDLVSEMAHKIGWEHKEEDGHIRQQFKALLFGAAGAAGDKT